MKKLKKLFVALLAAAMLLSLTSTAFALTEADPNECPYCGIGSYREHLLHWQGTYLADRTKCPDWPGEWHGMLQDVYTAKMACSNPDCKDSIYATYPVTQTYVKYVDRERICTHEYSGMSLGGEIQ